MKIVVIGLGQSLRGDDAAGLEAVRLWSRTYPETASRPEVQIEMGGLPGLGLLDILDGADAAVMADAVRSQASAGTIHRLVPKDLAAFQSGAQSAHGWGVAETLALAAELGISFQSVPIGIVGVEAGQLDVGAALSEEVARALPLAAQAIEEEVRKFLKAR